MQHLAGAKLFGGSHRLWPLHWGLRCFTIHYFFHSIGRIPTKTGNLSKNQHFFEKYDMDSSKGSIVSNGWNRPADRSNSGSTIEPDALTHSKSFQVDSAEDSWEQGNMEMKGSDTRRCCEQQCFFLNNDLDLVLIQSSWKWIAVVSATCLFRHLRTTLYKAMIHVCENIEHAKNM